MLLNWIKRKESKSFEEQVLPHFDALYRYAMRLTRNERNAEDLVQETIVKAMSNFEKFDGRYLKAWLFKILYHQFVNEYRRSQRRTLLTDHEWDQWASENEEALELENPEEILQRTEMQDSIKNALNEIQADFRAPVVLADLEGFSYKEIAEILDVPIGTVMSRLYRGRKLLRKELRSLAEQRGIVDSTQAVSLDEFKRKKKANGLS